MRWIPLLVLLLASVSWGTDFKNTQIGTLGTLSACAVAPCALPNTVQCDGYAAIYFEFVFTGTATAEIDEKLSQGTNFILVTGTSGSANATFKIEHPGGAFRGNVTAYTNGNVTVNFQCVREL